MLKRHKVGDLLMALDDEINKTYALGQISKIKRTRYGPSYKIMWLDGFDDCEGNEIDKQKLEELKGVYEQYVATRGKMD